jgi:hypothetical protein
MDYSNKTKSNKSVCQSSHAARDKIENQLFCSELFAVLNLSAEISYRTF